MAPITLTLLRRLPLVGLTALVALVLVLPGNAAAHGGGLPWIWLEEEVVEPGTTVNVLIVDFAPYSSVSIRAQAGQTDVAVGSIPTEGDGHGEGLLTIPPDFPDGYATLVGTDTWGSEGTVLIQVGESAGMGPPPPGGPPSVSRPGQVAGQGSWWQDPSVVTLGLMLGVAAAALGYLVLSRRRPHAPVSPATAQALRPRPRKRDARGARPRPTARS
jgi:hypothetical protein